MGCVLKQHKEETSDEAGPAGSQERAGSKGHTINKRQKQSNNVKVYFKNKKDQAQYENILKDISKCELIQNLKVPSDINSEIAQYANGTIISCTNEECNDETSSLNETFAEEILKRFDCIGYCTLGPPHNDVDIMKSYRQRWFCKSCSPHYIKECDDCFQKVLVEDTTCSDTCDNTKDTYFCKECGQCCECGKNVCPCDSEETRCYKFLCNGCNHNCTRDQCTDYESD